MWMTLIAWDLIHTIRKQTKQNGKDKDALWIHQATIDVRAAQPLVTAHVSIAALPQPRWTTLRLDAATCTLPSGQVTVDFEQGHDDKDDDYTLTATCPVADTQAHADYIWNTWVVQPSNATTTATTTTRSTKVSQDSYAFWATCNIQIRLRLGRILPYTYTHTLEWNNNKNQQNKTTNANQGSAAAAVARHHHRPTIVKSLLIYNVVVLLYHFRIQKTKHSWRI